MGSGDAPCCDVRGLQNSEKKIYIEIILVGEKEKKSVDMVGFKWN